MENIVNQLQGIAIKIANDKTTLEESAIKIDAYIDWIELEEYVDQETLLKLRVSIGDTVKALSDTCYILSNNFTKKDLTMMGDVLGAFAG